MADALAARGIPAGLLVALGGVAAAGNLAANGGGIPGLSAGTALLAAASLGLALRRLPPLPADMADWTCFGLALAFAAAPSRAGALAALLLLAWPCLRRGRPAGGAGVLLLAAGGVGLFDLLGSAILAPRVMALEATTVAALLHAAGIAATAAGNLVALPEARHTLLILRGCSALVLLPEMLVASLALALLLRPAGPGSLAAGRDAVLLAAAMALLLNLARLAGMAASAPLAEALHGEAGRAGLQMLWTAVALLAALVA
ncbi:hypothetical protein ACFQS7_20430 [Dankookia sp. GCM10030260]|uniref:hypothetical protein n=1 Tax=Dankookia sp. GCM10030260 TaxID=3273390 RepID=UPI00361D06D1